MKKKALIGKILFVLISLILAFIPTQVKALSLGITPTDFHFDLDPGKSKIDYILITNNEEVPLEVRAYTEAFQPIGETEEIEFNKDSVDAAFKADLYQIEIEPNQFFLEAKEQREIKFTVKTSENLPPGGYYRGIIFENVIDPTKLKGVAQQIQGQVGIPILLGITSTGEEIKDTGEIIEFKTDKSFYEQGPIKFSLKFKNTGAIHYVPGGRIDIYNKKGKVVKELRLQGKSTLPETIRTIETTWDKKSIAAGTYRAKATLFYGLNGARKAEAETTFRVFPTTLAKYGLIILSGLVFLLILFTLLQRKKRKKKPKEPDEISQ